MVGNNRLGRPTDHRMAVLRNLVTSLIEHGKIETTQANAVEAQKLAEKFITLAIKNEADYTVGKKKVSRAKLDAKGNKMTTKKTSKNGREYTSVVRETVEVEVKVDSPARLHARRQILGFLYNVKDENGLSKMVVNKLFDEIAPKYKERKGGYTRILKMGQRRGDGAEVAILELI